jgi:class 3 adenylate cyclase
MPLVVVERVVDCASEPRELWPLVTDTERLNRAIGLGKLELAAHDDATAARYLVRTVSGGFPLEYEERPFEWEEPRHFSVKRVVRRGLAKSIENRFELAPRAGGGTRLTIRIAVDPAVRWIVPVMRLQVSRFAGRIAAEFQQLDAKLARGEVSASHRRAPAERSALARLSQDLLAAVDERDLAAARMLIEHVRDAPDLDVDRIRPFELADRWQLDRRSVLGVCLHAVSVGILELTWDLVCPSCRTATERMRSLTTLEGHAHCQLCDISYEIDLDRAVEATFRPTPIARSVDEGPYCIGGPARTPHVLTQALLPGGGRLELSAPEKPGRYRLFVRGGPAAILRVGSGGAGELRVRVEAGALEPAQADLSPGARIVISQSDARERHAKIERLEWSEAAATAHHVSMLPGFRRQFSREVLRPGLALRISRVALLFTDLTGSTALYTAVGDAKAFGVVQDHFELLGKLVSEHDGTLVKTIGDAVMAAFPSEEGAVRAAVAMHRAFPRFRAAHAEAQDLRLKAGVFAGPCYVVTANGALDYFGQSVNVAARLQGAAGPGELVVPAHLGDLARESGWLEDGLEVVRFDAQLKGLSAPLTAERIAVDVP